MASAQSIAGDTPRPSEVHHGAAERQVERGLRFDHLGVLVKKLSRGREALRAGLQIERWTSEVVDEVNGVKLQFGVDPAGICYELLEPLNDASPVAVALKQGTQILNHVAYRVADLTSRSQQLRSVGWSPTAEPRPAIAYGGRSIQFFISPFRMLIELIEAPDHEHIYEVDGAVTDVVREPGTRSSE